MCDVFIHYLLSIKVQLGLKIYLSCNDVEFSTKKSCYVSILDYSAKVLFWDERGIKQDCFLLLFFYSSAVCWRFSSGEFPWGISTILLLYIYSTCTRNLHFSPSRSILQQILWINFSTVCSLQKNEFLLFL